MWASNEWTPPQESGGINPPIQPNPTSSPNIACLTDLKECPGGLLTRLPPDCDPCPLTSVIVNNPSCAQSLCLYQDFLTYPSPPLSF